MVFTSIPAYPEQAHWHQHPNNQAGPSNGTHQLSPPPLQPPEAAPQPHGGGGGSIRPGSMTDRARLANIPMPESALKCPRCESTNTKFCYFNNYNLTQPRHFCKTCKRYWTRGGALRNVPVGGGYRRNKRSKGSSSKSASVTADDRQRTSSSSSTISSKSTEILGFGTQFPPMRFMSPMTDHFGLNYGTTPAPLGGPSEFGAAAFTAHGMTGFDQWRIQQAAAPQFPYLGGLESSYQFDQTLGDGTYSDGSGHYVRAKVSCSVSTQMASLKMEGNNNNHHHHQELNLSRQFLGVPGNDEYWGTGHAWTDISSFSSSSTSNHL